MTLECKEAEDLAQKEIILDDEDVEDEDDSDFDEEMDEEVEENEEECSDEEKEEEDLRDPEKELEKAEGKIIAAKKWQLKLSKAQSSEDVKELLSNVKPYERCKATAAIIPTKSFTEFMKGVCLFMDSGKKVSPKLMKSLVLEVFGRCDVFYGLSKELSAVMKNFAQLSTWVNVFNFMKFVPDPSQRVIPMFFSGPLHYLRSKRKSKLVAAYQNLWLDFMKYKIPNSVLLIAIPFITDNVLDNLREAHKTSDFFFTCFKHGDLLGILSMGAIFKLIVAHNFEYPDFFDHVYSLTKSSILYTDHKEKFFKLIDKFLSSTHIPLYIVAAFVKKMCRMLLVAPLDAQEPLLGLIRNLVTRHPMLTPMVHRDVPETLASDPFDEEERVLSKVKALNSSLWEIKTLQKHYHSSVGKRAFFVNKALQKMESFVRYRCQDELFSNMMAKPYGKNEDSKDDAYQKLQDGSDEDDDQPSAKKQKFDGKFDKNKKSKPAGKFQKKHEVEKERIIPVNFTTPDGHLFPMNVNSPIPGFGSLGGETPAHGPSSLLGGHGPGSIMNQHGPGSVLGPSSIIGPSSIVGPNSILGSSLAGGSHQPQSMLHSQQHSLMGGFSHVDRGGPPSHMNMNLNINPGSVLMDMNPASVGPNLAVPMTPLNMEIQYREPHNMPQSNLQTAMPQTPAGAPDIPMPTLQNIVSTVNLGVALDLKDIALRARNAEYNPKRFAAVIMRIREPRTTALIFSSGKMVCTGAKSEEASRLAARKYARIIQKLQKPGGPPVKFTEFKVQNMVGSCDVKFPIQLEGLCVTHGQFSTYEPELFPGLIYRMVKPRVVLLIFVSGKVVITGAKFKRDIDLAFSQIYPILKGFRKTNS